MKKVKENRLKKAFNIFATRNYKIITMKKLFILLIACLLSANLFGQASIKIYTLLDEAKFKIIFNGEVENVIPIKEIFYDSLDHKKMHQIRIVFTADSIADIDEEVLLLKDEKKEFEILKKRDIRKKTSKIGRKIGKFLKIGKHDKDEILYDVFYIEDRTKSEYLND